MSASGMIAKAGRQSFMALKRLFSVQRGSNYEEDYSGKVFWLLHGECSNDETNTLAGVIDSGLTAFGKIQSHTAGVEAGKIVQREEKEFAYVYTSYMLRALGTLKIISSTEGATSMSSRLVVRGDIASRSFGVFTNANKVLLRGALGNEIFEKLINSSEASPLGGEGVHSIHQRCMRFYNKVLVPHLLAGENVLVITHADFLNVMAYVLSKKDIKTYRSFTIPHGKVLSSKELCDLMDRDTGNTGQALDRVVRTHATIRGEIAVVAMMSGIVAKAVLEETMTIETFLILSSMCAFVSTAFAYLDVSISSTIKKIPQRVWMFVLVCYAIRWMIFVPLLWTVVSEDGGGVVTNKSLSNTTSFENSASEAKASLVLIRWSIWWLLPPSMTNIAHSLEIGGNLYPSASIPVVMCVALSILMCLLLVVLPSAESDDDDDATYRVVNMSEIYRFVGVLVLGMLLPCALTQWWRKVRPVQSVNFRDRYRPLGVACELLGIFFLGYFLTPNDVADHVNCLLSLRPTDRSVECTAPAFYSGDVLSPLLMAIVMNTSMRLFGALTWASIMRCVSRMVVTKTESTDIYLLLTRPDLLLWVSIFVASDEHTGIVDTYTILFGALIHMFMTSVERMLTVDHFVKALIQQSVSTMRMPKSEIDDLWEEVKLEHRDYLTKDDLAYAIWIICKQTQGWSPGPMKLDMLARKLMRVMMKGNGNKTRVPYDAFFKYFAWHGKKMDFNTTKTSGREYEEDEFGTDVNDDNRPFNEADVRDENSEFNRKWFGKKRKSSLVRHFRKKRNSMVVPEEKDAVTTSEEEEGGGGFGDLPRTSTTRTTHGSPATPTQRKSRKVSHFEL